MPSEKSPLLLSMLSLHCLESHSISDKTVQFRHGSKCSIYDVMTLFLDALASLEPTQVARSVGDSFKLWAIGALRSPVSPVSPVSPISPAHFAKLCTFCTILHILHNFAHFAQLCTFCTILHILHTFAHIA